MFSQISWGSYFQTVSILVVIYYLVVITVYFRTGLSTFLKGKTIVLPFAGVGTTRKIDVRKEATHKDELCFHSIIDELNAFFEENKRSKCNKEELIYSLRRILKKHPVDTTDFFKESLNNLIQVQCESICAHYLSENDLSMVWK